MDTVTKQLSVRKTPSSFLVLPFLVFLHDSFSQNINKMVTLKAENRERHMKEPIEMCLRFAKKLRKALIDRLDPTDPRDECNVPFICAAYLHPAFRHFLFISDKQQRKLFVVRFVALLSLSSHVPRFLQTHLFSLLVFQDAAKAQLLQEHLELSGSVRAPAAASPPPASAASAAASAAVSSASSPVHFLPDSFFKLEVDEQQDQQAPAQNEAALRLSFMTECAEYDALPVVNRDADPLKWWREATHRVSSLRRLAARYLAIQATSVASESLFSAAGLIISERRSSLKPGNAELLTLMNANDEVSAFFDFFIELSFMFSVLYFCQVIRTIDMTTRRPRLASSPGSLHF